jgi:radical SAM protein with 4Fe4S-binding SPASM domain
MSTLKGPLTAQLEITDKCNFRCHHCYHLDFQKPCFSGDLSSRELFTLAEKLANEHIFSVVITGGEPLLRSKDIPQLLHIFASHSIDISLNTNLSLITDSIICELSKYDVNLLISCPSFDEKLYRKMTGTSSLLVFKEKLEMCLMSELKCAVNMVVNQNNLHDIRNTANALQKIGVRCFGATPMGLNPLNPDLGSILSLTQVRSLISDLVWIKDNLGLNVDIFEALAKCVFPPSILQSDLSFIKRKCQAGKTVVSISNNGEVRPCSHNNQSYGNLFDENLSDIWAKMHDWRDNSYVPIDCQKCLKVDNCSGGCRISAKIISGECRGRDPWMDVPIMVSDKVKSINYLPVDILPSMHISVRNKLKWRLESPGEYLVATSPGLKNVSLINIEMFNFLLLIQASQDICIKDLAFMCEIESDNQAFLSVLRVLNERRLITISVRGEV